MDRKLSIHYNQCLDNEDKKGFGFFGEILGLLRREWRHDPEISAFHTPNGILEPKFNIASPAGMAPISLQLLATAMYEFERCGQNVISIGPNMAKAFSETELDNVPMDHLRAPFEAFYVDLKGCGLKAWGGAPGVVLDSEHNVMGSKGTGWHEMEGAYVCWQQGSIYVHYIGTPNERSVDFEDGAHGYASLPIDRIWLELAKIHAARAAGKDPFLSSTSTAQWLKENPGLISAVDKRLRENGSTANIEQWLGFLMDPKNKNEEYTTSDKITLEQSAYTHKLFRIIINAVLYLNSPKADKVVQGDGEERKRQKRAAVKLVHKAEKATGRSRRRLLEKAQKTLNRAFRTGYRRVWVGPHIEERISAALASGVGKERGPQKGHVRKGHWHVYKVGPRKDAFGERIPSYLQDEILHWIPPTWCGDLDNLGTPKAYSFKDA